MERVNEYHMFPIGRIDIECNRPYIILNEEYAAGIKHLSSFSHIILISEQDHNADIPFLEQKAHIEEIKEKEGIIYLDKMRHFSKSNVYDIKPYFPCEDRVKECTVPEGLYTEKETKKQFEKLPAENIQSLLRLTPLGEIRKRDDENLLVLNESYEMLRMLESYSHIKIFWWFSRFDKNRFRRITECDPPYENAPRTGVFASRSPVRPNPIALTTARILNIDAGCRTITVSQLDCFDRTPLMAVLPYVPDFDRVEHFKVPAWLCHWPEWLDDRHRDNSFETISLGQSCCDIINNFVQADNTASENLSGFFCESGGEEYADDGVIGIKGAKQNNLKNVDVNIPYKKMTVIAGISGSGKTSLAFDTLFSESQRRFSDSIGWGGQNQLEKPAFEQITGLPPAIAISQKSIGRNPRSTVGTMTGLYDYLRTLFTIIGIRHCPDCGKAITPMSADEIVACLSKLPMGTDFSIYPYGKQRAQQSFTVTEDITSGAMTKRIAEVLEQGNGAFEAVIGDNKTLFQITQMCYHCNRIFFEMTPLLFSYNDPESMCTSCNGLGVKMELDPDLIITRPYLSILDGASNWWGNLRAFRDKPNANWMKGEVLALADKLGIDLDQPWERLPEEFRQKAIWGTNGVEVTLKYENQKNGRSGEITRPVEGAFNILSRLFNESTGESAKKIAETFMRQCVCEKCHGERLGAEGRLVTIAGIRFPQTASMTMIEINKWICELPKKLTELQLHKGASIIKKMHVQLKSYDHAGLSYLSLARSIPTLSGGELQRLKLVSRLGAGLSNMLYVLDEPSCGLHPRDFEKLILIMKKLIKQGNTVVTVEHNREIMEQADYLIEMGPGAGAHGGWVVAEGTPANIMSQATSETGKYLAGEKQVSFPCTPLEENCDWIEIKGAVANNLKSIDVTIPIGKMTCITGISGSGKSTLVSQVLLPAIKKQLNGEGQLFCRELKGADKIDNIVHIDQQPIGRTPRSNPATYVGIFDEIRKIYAMTAQAKEKGYTASSFSFNSEEGQCSACNGEGRICSPVPFMADIWTPCHVCKGKRYKAAILTVKYNDRDIAEVLDMNVEEAGVLFSAHRNVKQMFDVLIEVGLGYIKLGQSATTLSGGEAQRIKLAKELKSKITGRTLYILDEPTTGLHFSDVQNLLCLLRKITNAGNSVVIIEHNMDMAASSDWIIDLGPEGGDLGGEVVAQGSPDQIIKTEKSYTGKALAKLIHI